MPRDMRQDGDARFGIGGATAQQPSALHGAAERRFRPLTKIAGGRGIDAGIEAQHGAGRRPRDLDQDGHVLALAVAQQARPQMAVLEPRMHDAQHRLR